MTVSLCLVMTALLCLVMTASLCLVMPALLRLVMTVLLCLVSDAETRHTAALTAQQGDLRADQPLWRARSKIDGHVPKTQYVDLKVVG